MDPIEDAFDMQHDNDAPHVEPLQLPQKKTQNDYIQEWLPHKEEFMKVLLDLEAPPKPQNCARVTHQGLLFHRVQQWAGNFFKESALHMVRDQSMKSGDNHKAGHRQGLSSILGTAEQFVHWICQVQVMLVGPAQLIERNGKMWMICHPTCGDLSGRNISPWSMSPGCISSHKLCQITSAMFPHLVPDRYHELLRVAWQWRLLKLMKWSGILECTDTHKQGDLVLFCATCPQLGINVDLAEDLNQNFKAEHMHDRHPADQVWMMDGRRYMVSDSEYQAYLQATPHVTEKLPCNNHRAINQANANRSKLHSTRIGAMACVRHGCFYLHSVVDFQKGERQLNMDYSLANALHYNMAGINKIMPGIRIWHVHGHKQECYVRYPPLFMKGAGWVDSEIIKTLWSLLNVVSASVQGMSSLHRQELLDFQMSDCNFMKMIRMVDSLSRKLAAMWVAADLAMQAFQMLDEGTAPTVHAIKLELLENTSNVGMQLSIGSWLVRGLQLEEASITLRIDHHHVGAHAPELKRLAIARQIERLSSEQSVFIADGAVYFGVQHEVGGISSAKHGWDGSMDDPLGISGKCTSDPDEPNDSTDRSLTMDAADLVGSMSLPLPSNLGINQCIASGLDSIQEIELKLQIGQANDVLHGLWLALVDKVVVFQNVVWQAKSYAMKTWAWDMIHTINSAVCKQATIYKQCQAVMVSLGATEETLSRFQEMQKSHLTVSTAAISQNAHDHQGSQLPWFWSIDMPRDTESITWMSEFYRIHWLRAKVVQDCWTEEQELLMAKFQWTLNFFTHQAAQWRIFQSKCEAVGPTCYAAKQIAIFE
ncbi:hypothetical protein BKA82DRAFT_4010686 [Pisolithus tinctorius]|nr:hypothetical protein BKA82DRAFT_4010686 [Pisolithus tinctorius]